ncbi:MAG: metallophosphoesterase family protein [Thermoplasmata archaeon]
MRMLAATDIHSSNPGARAIRNAVLAHRPELTLICGDVTHFGPLSWAEAFLENLPGDVLAIPGNCDPPEMVSILEDLGISLHAKEVKIEGHAFVGLGASSLTPFNTPFELSEDEIRSTLRPLMKRGAILVTHDAPRGHLDKTAQGDSVGSAAIREVIEEFSPTFSIFGHIHESPGVQEEKTIFVNPGAAMFGRYAIIDTETQEVLLKEDSRAF